MSLKSTQKNGLTWVHINELKSEDVEEIKKLYRFHPLLIESIENPTLHPALEDYKTHLFLILHFPIIYRDRASNVAAEVDFIITKNLLITITYRDYPRLEEFFKRFSNNKKLQQQYAGEHTGKLLYGIIDWLLGSLIDDLDFLEEQVTNIEEKIFERRHKTIVEDILHAWRDILDFKRIVSPLETVLKLLPRTASQFFGSEVEPYFTNLMTSESKIRHLIENHKETIEALHETNESLLSNRVSTIITVLTIFSAIILPLNFIASIWGMNHTFLPLRDGQYDFWIIIGAMSIIAIAAILIFRSKKWL